MRLLIKSLFVVIVFITLINGKSSDIKVNDNNSLQTVQDTCIIEGMLFDLLPSEGSQELSATIKNGHIHVVKTNLQGEYKIIRYVFSIMLNEKVPLVRSYNNLISYPVIQNLKKSKIGEQFYFEEIIIVNPEKKILNNQVKPVVIKRVK